MTTEVDPEQQSTLSSCDTNYYLTISELLESSDQSVQKFLTKTKKGNFSVNSPRSNRSTQDQTTRSDSKWQC